MLNVKGCSETLFFREWSNQVCDNLYFSKKSRYDGNLLFQIVQNLMCFPEMEQENPKNFLVFKIIPFKPESTNSRILEQDTSH